jgi:hypothetical protein
MAVIVRKRSRIRIGYFFAKVGVSREIWLMKRRYLFGGIRREE